jgi:hypothetical protein
MLKQNTVHEATQMIKDALYTMNTVQKKKEESKAIHVTGLGSLLGGDVDPTVSRQLVHSWRLGCQPYLPKALYHVESVQK